MTRSKAGVSHEPTRKSPRLATMRRKSSSQISSQQLRDVDTLQSPNNKETVMTSRKTRKRKSIGELISIPLQLSSTPQQASSNSAVGETSSSRDDQQAMLASLSEMDIKDILEMTLLTLEKMDTNKIFVEPVDSREADGYYQIIRKPMDFATMKRKLQKGLYKTVELFERDLYLIFSNAMVFNPSSTIYYQEARRMKEWAKKVLLGVRNDLENYAMEEAKRKEKLKRVENEIAQLAKTYGLTGPERSEIMKSSNCERSGTYGLWLLLNENISSASTYNEPKLLVPADGEVEKRYEDSLRKFVENLGPTAKMVADRKLGRIIEASSGQQASLGKTPSGPLSAETVKQTQTPLNSDGYDKMPYQTSLLIPNSGSYIFYTKNDSTSGGNNKGNSNASDVNRPHRRAQGIRIGHATGAMTTANAMQRDIIPTVKDALGSQDILQGKQPLVDNAKEVVGSVQAEKSITPFKDAFILNPLEMTNYFLGNMVENSTGNAENSGPSVENMNYSPGKMDLLYLTMRDYLARMLLKSKPHSSSQPGIPDWLMNWYKNTEDLIANYQQCYKIPESNFPTMPQFNLQQQSISGSYSPFLPISVGNDNWKGFVSPTLNANPVQVGCGPATNISTLHSDIYSVDKGKGIAYPLNPNNVSNSAQISQPLAWDQQVVPPLVQHMNLQLNDEKFLSYGDMVQKASQLLIASWPQVMSDLPLAQNLGDMNVQLNNGNFLGHGGMVEQAKQLATAPFQMSLLGPMDSGEKALISQHGGSSTSSSPSNQQLLNLGLAL